MVGNGSSRWYGLAVIIGLIHAAASGLWAFGVACFAGTRGVIGAALETTPGVSVVVVGLVTMAVKLAVVGLTLAVRWRLAPAHRLCAVVLACVAFVMAAAGAAAMTCCWWIAAHEGSGAALWPIWKAVVWFPTLSAWGVCLLVAVTLDYRQTSDGTQAVEPVKESQKTA